MHEVYINTQTFPKAPVYENAVSLTNPGLPTLTGEHHTRVRAAVSQVFEHPEQHFIVASGLADELVQALKNTKGFQSADAHISEYMMSNVCDVGVGGKDALGIDPPRLIEMCGATERNFARYVTGYLLIGQPVWDRLSRWLPGLRDMHATIERVRAAATQVADVRRQQPDSNTNYDIVGAMLSRAMPSTDIANEIVSSLASGYQSGSSGVLWALYYLAQNPDELVLIHTELTTSQNADLNDYASINLLPHLHHFILETLRLGALSLSFDRIAACDATICGQHIPKGTIVGQSHPMAHRHESNFPQEPHSFRPSRFVGSDEQGNTTGCPYRMTPFSQGARSCVASRYAIMLMKVMVCKLVLQFREIRVRGNGATLMRPTARPANVQYEFVNRN